MAAALGFGKPARLGRFVVIRLVGTGAMGDVYAAYDEELDRKVAVKVLRMDQGGAVDERRARMLREAQALARVNHPNVVTVHEVGVHEGYVFLAMEFVDGTTLRTWLDESHGWREIVRMFVEAGQGLRAAHAQGLVHRDFKPDNVLVGNDGRPRVLDFGLVTPLLESGQGSTVMEMLETHHFDQAKRVAVDRLTRSGAIMGTPAYMSPEQMLNGGTDPRTDEYAFSVALYEAIYGKRPHEASTFQELVQERLHGGAIPRPRGTGVPVDVHRVLERGMAINPDHRYPGMGPMLDDLERALRPRRGRRLAAAAVALMALGGVLAVTQTGPEGDACAASTDAVRAVWNDAAREQIRNAFDATQLPFAADAYAGAVARLDEYAAEWEARHRDACTAMLDGTEATDEVGSRMLCFGHRLRQLESTVGLLASADEQVVRRAAQAVSGLDSPSSCTSEQATAAWGAGASPEIRAQLETIDRALAVARANLAMGKYKEGLAALEGQEDAAGRLHHPATQARVLELQGELQARDGDPAAAEKTLRRGVRLADEAGDDATRAWLWIRLVRVVGYQLARHEEGMTLAEDARAALKRLGAGPDMQARLYRNMGSVAMRSGAYSDALAHHERALELLRERHGDDHPEVAATLNNVGNVQTAMGDPRAAERTHRRALASFEKALGAGHPDVGMSLHNLGNALFTAEDYAAAIESYERALAVRKAALGERHAAVARTLSNMGQAQLKAGRSEAALATFREAVELKEKSLGDRHPSLAYTLAALGQAHLALGDADAAREPLERALEIHESAKAPAEERAETAFALARAVATDNPARARDLAERARAAYASSGRYPGELAAVERWLEAHPPTAG